MGALALGGVLAALPFLQFGIGGGHRHASLPHTDHAPRWGGVVWMVGDHHLEVRETPEAIELYWSDAARRPLAVTRALLRLDRGETRELVWQSTHYVVPHSLADAGAVISLELADGSTVQHPLTLDRRARD